MLGEVVDALGQQRDLDLGVAHVLLAGAELDGELALAFTGDGGHELATVADGRERQCAPASSRVRSTSRCICSISEVGSSKRRSPRRRARNSRRSSLPYRSPSKSRMYASISSPLPVLNVGRTPMLTAAGSEGD